MDTDKYLTTDEAATLLKISKRSLWRAVKAGELPGPIYVAARSPRWLADEIRSHVQRLVDARQLAVAEGEK